MIDNVSKIGKVSDGFLELPALVNVRVISRSHGLKLVVLSRQIVSLSVLGEAVCASVIVP